MSHLFNEMLHIMGRQCVNKSIITCIKKFILKGKQVGLYKIENDNFIMFIGEFFKSRNDFFLKSISNDGFFNGFTSSV